MSDNSDIEWTDATWPITVGCDKCSDGCKNCYAMRSVHRVNLCQIGAGKPPPYKDLVELVTIGGRRVPRWTGVVQFFPERLAMPLRWKRPRRIFVSSQSDLFHDDVTNQQIASVFGMMAACPQHTFQVLTKRAKRMRAWFEWLFSTATRVALDEKRDMDIEWLYRLVCSRAAAAAPVGVNFGVEPGPWPLPNVWIGVSVENQAAADERIPELMLTPAAVRWISAEPLLGPVDLLPWFDPTGACDCPPGESYCVGGCAKRASWRHTEPDGEDPNLDWVVMGAESGPGARAADPEWFLELAEQCEDARVPLFFKQGMPGDNITAGDGSKVKAGGIISLPYLDGKQHVEMPEVRRG